MGIRGLLTGGAPEPCPICNNEGCRGFPELETPRKYPFHYGGYDPMEGQVEGVDFVLAPYAIEDEELGRIVYGAGDPVPIADAAKYGLVAEKKSPRKSKAAPAANRARKSTGNR